MSKITNYKNKSGEDLDRILWKNRVSDEVNRFRLKDKEPVTVSSGVITVSENFIEVTPETGTSDNINNINGYDNYSILFVVTTAGNTVTLKDGTGNLDLGADIVLDNVRKCTMLIYNGTNWVQIKGW